MNADVFILILAVVLILGPICVFFSWKYNRAGVSTIVLLSFQSFWCVYIFTVEVLSWDAVILYIIATVALFSSFGLGRRRAAWVFGVSDDDIESSRRSASDEENARYGEEIGITVGDFINRMVENVEFIVQNSDDTENIGEELLKLEESLGELILKMTGNAATGEIAREILRSSPALRRYLENNAHDVEKIIERLGI